MQKIVIAHPRKENTMPEKPHINRNGREWSIFPAVDEENYCWVVFAVQDDYRVVAYGHQRTYKSAFRAMRNFIKNNQNAVYGYAEAY